MLVRKRSFAEREYADTGLFGGLKKALKKATHTVTKPVAAVARTAVSTVRAVPVVRAAESVASLGADVARGRNLVSSVQRRTGQVVDAYRSALPAAATAVSVVPGLGTVAAPALAGAAAVAQGKSLRDVASEAAISAIPGGRLARAAMRVGIGAVRGQNVISSVADESARAAGGEAAVRALHAVANVARGGNIARQIGSEIGRRAGTYVPPIARR
jgi:hypothetical protein